MKSELSGESFTIISKYSSKVSYLMASRVIIKSALEFAGTRAVGLSSLTRLPSEV